MPCLLHCRRVSVCMARVVRFAWCHSTPIARTLSRELPQPSPACPAAMSAIFVRVDYPAKDPAKISVESSTTMSAFYALVEKTLNIESASKYAWSACVYGSDVVELQKRSNSDTLLAGGISAGWTLLGAAPGDIKPARSSKKKKAAEEEKGTFDENRYKGFTHGNALAKWEEAKTPKNKEIAAEYIDIHLKNIVKQSGWTKLSQKSLATLLARNTLSLKEGEIFDAVMVWVKAQKKPESESKNPVKDALGEAFNHIRFPCMETAAVASKVSATGALESQQLLDLFTYLATKAAGQDGKLPASLSMFKAVPRKPRSGGSWVWSEKLKHNSVTISEKGRMVTCSSSNQNVAGDVVFETGVHEWDWVIEGNSSPYVMCGFMPAEQSFDFNSGGRHVGETQMGGWGLYTYGTWQLYRNGSASTPGSGHSQSGPQTVGVRLNMDKGTCEFFAGTVKSGRSLGTVISGLSGMRLRPAVTLYSGSFRTVFPGES